ncbi:MAG: hypothetical protein KDD44_03940 [Bdellovibrionales bacterium]|nr:hypothetical protein [Bdellovibrionales bacterium]
MAKSTQQTFEGDGFPKRLPKAVAEARDAYLGHKRKAANAAKRRQEAEVILIDLMQKHEIDRVQLDGENKFIEVEATPKAKVKTMPKAQREGADIGIPDSHDEE